MAKLENPFSILCWLPVLRKPAILVSFDSIPAIIHSSGIVRTATEDLDDHRRIFDGGDDHQSDGAVGAVFHVDIGIPCSSKLGLLRSKNRLIVKYDFRQFYLNL